VTLTGSGGIGKTRLALQAASELLDAYPDGVWWSSWQRCETGAVVQAVAKVREVREIPNQPWWRRSSILSAIDNCCWCWITGHLISACAQLVDSLAQRCQNLRILATSREHWILSARRSGPCHPYRYLICKGIAARALGKFESIRLFTDRAASVQPGSNYGRSA